MRMVRLEVGFIVLQINISQFFSMSYKGHKTGVVETRATRRSPRKTHKSHSYKEHEGGDDDEEEEAPTYGEDCIGTTYHAKEKWIDLKPHEDPEYIKEGQRFHDTACGNCHLKFVNKNAHRGQTLWCRDHPSRVCMVCSNYAICWNCYLVNLNENEDKSGRRRRR